MEKWESVYGLEMPFESTSGFFERIHQKFGFSFLVDLDPDVPLRPRSGELSERAF